MPNTVGACCRKVLTHLLSLFLYHSLTHLLTHKDDKNYVENSGWKNKLHDVGIAGISAFDSVKCLHCHYSHYLGKPEHGNLIGEWVHELLSERGRE